MAEHVVFPVNIKLHFRRDIVKKQFFVPKNSQFGTRRNCFFKGSKDVEFLSSHSRSFCSHLANEKLLYVEKRITKCCCLGSFISADNPATFEWIPIADQVLLMASAFLTYIAGVNPANQVPTNTRKDGMDNISAPNNYSAGSLKENDEVASYQFVWDEVEVKLLDSLRAIKEEVIMGDQETGPKGEVALRPLSLYALAECPRLRLMSSSFQWLKKEVDNVRKKYDSGCSEDLLTVFTRMLQNSSQPLCFAWLEEEFNLDNSMPNKAFLSSTINKFSGDDSMLLYIKKLGKLELYTEFFFTLISGSPRMNGCYDDSLFKQYGVSILEDLVITIANGIASTYLKLISVDSKVSNEVTNLGSRLCTLSTRALQRLRNEVALHQWMHQNMQSVVLMYEDRFELFTFQRHVIEETGEHEAVNFNWFKNICLRRSGSMPSTLSFVVISPASIYVKRTKELRSLTGWQYYFSLLLELGDIALPVIRAVIAKVSDAISFFLVCLIGRSLGLIYTGIRQSLRWK